MYHRNTWHILQHFCEIAKGQAVVAHEIHTHTLTHTSSSILLIFSFSSAVIHISKTHMHSETLANSFRHLLSTRTLLNNSLLPLTTGNESNVPWIGHQHCRTTVWGGVRPNVIHYTLIIVLVFFLVCSPVCGVTDLHHYDKCQLLLI